MITEEFRSELKEYLRQHQIAITASASVKKIAGAGVCIGGTLFSQDDCEEYIRNNKESSFLDTFWRYIDEKQLDYVAVYKNAQINRQHFSKIRNGQSQPSKKTIIRLAIAMKLDEPETEQLLHSAGFKLSKSFNVDLIVRFCLQNGCHDLREIDGLIYELTSQSLMNESCFVS